MMDFDWIGEVARHVLTGTWVCALCEEETKDWVVFCDSCLNTPTCTQEEIDAGLKRFSERWGK